MGDSNQAESTITLPEEFLLSTLSELKTSIDGILEDKPPLILDGSQVDRVDGAALQFLWQYHDFCTQKEKSFQLENPSEVIREALTDLGMQHVLPVS